jgi:HSP20 family protein
MLLRSNDLFPMLFNEVFNNVNDGWNKNSARDPQINILEGNKDYKIEICVPGRNKSDLSLTIDTDNNLVISMEHHNEASKTEATATVTNATADAATSETPVVKAEPKEEYHFLRHDFHRAHFKEIISLPDNIHRDRILAKVDNGILTIVLPKVLPEEQAKLAQTITIE